MSTLYSVTFQKKRFITKYDAKGHPLDTYDVMVEETIHDLPLTTAQGYVKNMGAIIVGQSRGEDRPALRKDRIKFKDISEAPRRTETTKAVKRTAPKAAPEIAKPRDYADLVNVMMDKSE